MKIDFKSVSIWNKNMTDTSIFGKQKLAAKSKTMHHTFLLIRLHKDAIHVELSQFSIRKIERP